MFIYDKAVVKADMDELIARDIPYEKLKGKTVLVTDANESYKVQINGLSQDGFLCGLRDGVQTKIICGDVKEV